MIMAALSGQQSLRVPGNAVKRKYTESQWCFTVGSSLLIRNIARTPELLTWIQFLHSTSARLLPSVESLSGWLAG